MSTRDEEIENKQEEVYDNDSYNEHVDNTSNDSSNSIKEDTNIETNENDNNTLDENHTDNISNDIKNKKSSIKNKADFFANLILVLILFGLFSLLDTQKSLLQVEESLPKWEYQTVYLDATNSAKYVDNKLNSAKVKLTGDMINEYGSEGWELVDTYLEMETVHPNYGNSDYVTGLQPNVRPQRLVLIFKRPL